MSLPNTMRAVQAVRRGSAGELQVRNVPVPQPGPGQVLIRVESASVNFSDVKRRRGDAYPFATEFPFVPGGEVAGTVAATGPGVSQPGLGTQVFALVGGDGQGGYAQFALAYAQQAVPLPPGFDTDRASAITIAGATAMLLLKEAARLQAGESVLVPAAAGSVGSYLIQLARLFKAGRIIAATSSPEKGRAAKALGADLSVDYTSSTWPDEVRRATDGRGVDILLEASGGETLEQGLRALAPFGRAVVYGAASGRDAVLGAESLRSLLYAPAANQSLAGFNVGSWFLGRSEVAGAAMGELVDLMTRGVINAPAIHTLTLGEAAEAHRRLEERVASGKIVLKPWQE